MDIFVQIGICIITGAAIAVLGSFIKQPSLLGYIAAGILLGPTAGNVIQDPELINTVSHIGIMLLLFLIGLEMGVDKLKDMGLVSLAAGVGQVLFTGLIGFGLCFLLGFSIMESAYVAVALTFSSTVIAVKLMSEKQDLGSLYGQISVGILIVQDLLAIVALLVLAGFGNESGGFDPALFGGLLLKGAALAAGALLLSKLVLKQLFRKIADSGELLLLCAIAWCFINALIAKKIGFSMEIGAFIAGISLANLPYAPDINAKARVIRDFFVTIFFIALGAGMVFSDISSLSIPLILLSAFVLIGNPLIIMTIMRAMGYDMRTGLFTGLNMANISEFSLIVATLGATLGHINQQTMALITIICVITMVSSSYMISFSEQIYRFLKPVLKKWNPTSSHRTLPKDLEKYVIVLGYGDSGKEIVRKMLHAKIPVLVVEHNNTAFQELQKANIPALFGSTDDEEILQAAHFDRALCIISTLPQAEDTMHIIRFHKHLPASSRPPLLVTAHSGTQGLTYFNAGADYVVVKPHVGARMLVETAATILKKDLTHEATPATGQVLEQDIDYTRFVEQLSALRLQELQR